MRLPMMPMDDERSKTDENKGAAAGKTDARAEVFLPTRKACPCSQMSPQCEPMRRSFPLPPTEGSELSVNGFDKEHGRG